MLVSRCENWAINIAFANGFCPARSEGFVLSGESDLASIQETWMFFSLIKFCLEKTI